MTSVKNKPVISGRDGPPPKEKGPQRRVEYAPEDDAAPVAPSRGAGGAQREPEQYVEEEESASDAGESAVGSDVRSASPGSAESRSESDASESGHCLCTSGFLHIRSDFRLLFHR